MKKLFYIALILVAFASCKSDDGLILGTASAVDGDNTILSGITVKLYTTETDLYKTTLTDSKGDFVFTDLESGNYYIGATLVKGEDTFDTGNRPMIVYVNDDIEKKVALSLTKK